VIATADKLLQEMVEGRRLGFEEAVHLYKDADLLSLGKAAQQRRYVVVPEKRVTYLIDRNINYTNVCVTDCKFCAFYRPTQEHPEAYTLSRQEIAAKVEELLEAGGTRILMQGGHHPGLRLSWYEDLLQWLRKTYPEIELNCFSPSEIDNMARVEGLTMRQVLTRLQAAGLAGLPGGGGEMLVDEIRRKVSPKKQDAKGWLDAMRIAQSLGLTTTSTMVIGFGESLKQRVEHLQQLRDLQDESLEKHANGFTAFITWTLQTENTSLGRSSNSEQYGVGGLEYLRTVALSRLFLDNIPHVQASWPTQGVSIAQLALEFGCDDFGSTMMEENVVSSAGTSLRQVAERKIQQQVAGAGFTPAQRDSRYNIIRVIEQVPDLAPPRRLVTSQGS